MFCARKPQQKTEAKTWTLKNRKFYLFAENAPKCSKYLTAQIGSFFLTSLVNSDNLCWQRFSWGGRCLEKVEKVICFDRASQNSNTHGYKALFIGINVWFFDTAAKLFETLVSGSVSLISDSGGEWSEAWNGRQTLSSAPSLPFVLSRKLIRIGVLTTHHHLFQRLIWICNRPLLCQLILAQRWWLWHGPGP